MQLQGTQPRPAHAAVPVDGTKLWAAVTLHGVNKFTGALQVGAGARAGMIYFREGRLVHAEAGVVVGERAFFQIMRWPDASYLLQPEAGTRQATITRGLAMLLVDLRGGATGELPVATPAPVPPPIPTPRPPEAGGGRPERLLTIAEQIRQLPGVLSATLQGWDGLVSGPGPASTEDLQALALGQLGAALGRSLGLGRVVVGVAQGAERLVLHLTTREHQLTILTRADGQADAVQARIRALLSAQP